MQARHLKLKRIVTNSPPTHQFSTSFSPILGLNPIVSPPLPQGGSKSDDQGVMQSVEQPGAPSRTCGGALSSGNIANSAEGSLPLKCARILSITAGSSMQAMILT
jgi:hypothetical protein